MDITQQTQLLRAGSEVLKRGMMMEAKNMKPLRWPTNSDQHAYMRERQEQNLSRTKNNKNERWASSRLKTTGKKWTEQAMWGYRIFDFWCAELGIAIEIDGPEHNKSYDEHRDEYNYRRSGIVVFRVKNGDEKGMDDCICKVRESQSWKERKDSMGISGNSKAKRRSLVKA